MWVIERGKDSKQGRPKLGGVSFYRNGESWRQLASGKWLAFVSLVAGKNSLCPSVGAKVEWLPLLFSLKFLLLVSIALVS